MNLTLQKQSKLGILDIIKSVAASAIGVQSSTNKQWDFQQQSIVPYILVGIVFVGLFVLAPVAVVSFVIPG